MDEDKLLDRPDLPVDVSELGELFSTELECPNVYHLAVKPEGDHSLFPMEYYLVLDNAPISKEARKYGTPLENSHGLVFSLEQEGSGAKIIEYEIFKYRVLHHLPLPGNETLHGCAVYAAEQYPEYFGMLPVPSLTPWGYTTRHRALASGIYWIETDQCVEVLAVSHPVWAADLSGSVLRHARQTDYDTEHGIDRTFGYQFFSQKVSCVVIFELLQYHSEWLDTGRVYLPALMNAILKYWPEYAVTFNAHEQAGLNDGAGLFLRSMGIEVELSSSMERMITLTPGAGTEFLRWQVACR